ncbi:NADP-dependent oxidoreductase [Microbacterium sp.]|uniref:NADP-dependent oxidoreductase n=1 Tax=Microbacterium sp. TaxID=51671 RepID=UPI003F70EABE
MPRRQERADVVEYDRLGGGEVLEVRSRDLAPPGAGEVTVEVITAGINHIDGFIRSGRESGWTDEPWPRRSGSDFAGIITSVGADVGRFSRGDQVVGHLRSGAQATYVTVPAASLVKKPAHLTWEAAGGLFLAGATALDTLDELRIAAGDVVVISAAAGGVGSIEAQVAKHLGATVIGTCGDRNFDYLRQLGIKPIKYGEGIDERIRTAAGGKQVTAMIDNFGQDGRELAEALGVAPARYRSSEDRRATEMRLLQDDGPSIARATALLERLCRLAETRSFTLLVSGYYPLADVAEAYEDLARMHARGKVILGTHPVTTWRTLKARDFFEAAS